MGVPQGHVLGTFVTLTVNALQRWQQSHALRCLTAKHRCCRMEKRKRKNVIVSHRGWLRKGWHKSKSQGGGGLQNVDLTLKRGGPEMDILSIEVAFFLVHSREEAVDKNGFSFGIPFPLSFESRSYFCDQQGAVSHCKNAISRCPLQISAGSRSTK